MSNVKDNSGKIVAFVMFTPIILFSIIFVADITSGSSPFSFLDNTPRGVMEEIDTPYRD